MEKCFEANPSLDEGRGLREGPVRGAEILFTLFT